MKFLKIFLILIVFTQSQAMTIDCVYFQYAWQIVGEVYQCDASVNLLVDSDQSKVTAVTQNHIEGKGNNDVDYLDIYGQKLTTFPKGIEKLFPNLRGIIASDNNIKVISRDDLKVFPSLQLISFWNNDLTTLKDDLFTSTPNLQHVSLGYNKIKYIGKNVFHPLTNLKKLFLNGRSNCFSGEAETPDKLQKLISNLAIFCPYDNKTRSEAMILDCSFRFSGSSLYECAAEVKLLVDLGQKKVTAVTQNHVTGKTNDDVEILWIRHQNLTSLLTGIDQFFPNLKVIHASYNDIKNISKDDLKVFPRLEYIDFSNNKITTLEDDLFSFTPNLQVVNFGHNSIKHVGINTFSPLKNLTKLYLYGENNCVNGKAETHEEVEILISKLLVACPIIDAM